MTWTCRSAGSVARRGYSFPLQGCDADGIDRRQDSVEQVIKGLRWARRELIPWDRSWRSRSAWLAKEAEGAAALTAT